MANATLEKSDKGTFDMEHDPIIPNEKQWLRDDDLTQFYSSNPIACAVKTGCFLPDS
jgi:hypothetical protein